MEADQALILGKKIESKNLLPNVIEQINKDARLSGLEIYIDTGLSSKEAVVEIYKLLLELITKDFGAYLNLLYRIDLSEKSLKSITDTEPESIVKYVTLMVLQREWQKVELRNKIQ